MTPGSLDPALGALGHNDAFLLRGDVFTSDVIETWLDYKRKKEIDAIRLRPILTSFISIKTRVPAKVACDLAQRHRVQDPVRRDAALSCHLNVPVYVTSFGMECASGLILIMQPKSSAAWCQANPGPASPDAR